MEFCQMLLNLVPNGNEVELSISTTYDEYDVAKERKTKELLQAIAENFEDTDLKVAYEFENSSTFHARSIETDTGWKINLDRGLDIFDPTASTTFFPGKPAAGGEGL